MNILARLLNKHGVHLQYHIKIESWGYERKANIHPDNYSPQPEGQDIYV
jgi:hypothetical protein